MLFNQTKITETNKKNITAKADELIYEKYPQIKQNKLQSQGLKLTLKLVEGGILATEEIELKAYILSVDTWITNIRTIENTAIADGTLLADVVWK